MLHCQKQWCVPLSRGPDQRCENPTPRLEHSWGAEFRRADGVPDTPGLEFPSKNMQAGHVASFSRQETGFVLHWLCPFEAGFRPGTGTSSGALYTQTCQKDLCKHGQWLGHVVGKLPTLRTAGHSTSHPPQPPVHILVGLRTRNSVIHTPSWLNRDLESIKNWVLQREK